jgi:hypothetical protein
MNSLPLRPAKRRPIPRSIGRRRRGGIGTFELLLALPILLLVLLGVIQFGIFFVNIQQVSLASRAGAEEASQTPDLPVDDGAPVPDEVLSAIDHQLQSGGIARCSVRLEHNVGGTPVVLRSPAESDFRCGGDDILEPPPPREYVRLTVYVPLVELMPDCLRFFGCRLVGSSKVTSCTTVFRYELPIESGN